MRILEELTDTKPDRYRTAIVLTHNIDLAWFEVLVLRQLQRHGVRRVLIFADRSRLSETVETQLGAIHEAGRSYIVEGIKVGGSFHPKAFFLSGDNDVRLYVGSGNLTRGGYERNREVFARFDANIDDPSISSVFPAFQSYVEAVVGARRDATPDMVRTTVDHAFARIPDWPVVREGEVSLWGWPGTETLWARVTDAMRPREGSTVSGRLRLIAPFFDWEGKLATRLATALAVEHLEVVTDLRTTNLTPEGAGTITTSGGILRKISASDRRPLHAKLFHVLSAAGELAGIGSANLSNAAWHGQNAELMVLSTKQTAREVGCLIDGLESEVFTDDDLTALNEREAAPTEEDPESKEPAVIIWAEWASGSMVRVRCRAEDPAPTLADFRTRDGTRPVQLRLSREGALFVGDLDAGEIVQSRVASVRIVCGGVSGPWTVVQDRDELAEAARGASRSEFDLTQILASDGYDPDSANRIVTIVAQIWRERAQESARVGGVVPRGESQSGEPSGEASRVVHVRSEDFRTGGPAATTASSTVVTPQPVFVSSRMLNRLLLGEIEGNAHEGEDALPSDSGEAKRPGEMQSERPAPTASRGSSWSERERRFADAMRKSREAYFAHAGASASARSLDNLMNDLMLLTAPLHYLARQGCLRPREFQEEMIEILDSMLGRAGGPIPSALVHVSEDAALWARAPIFSLLSLLLYNTCLAGRVAVRDRTNMDADFAELAPVLAFRNIVRTAPRSVVAKAAQDAKRRIAQLRVGAFWIPRVDPATWRRSEAAQMEAFEWAWWAQAIPYEAFVGQMVGDAEALLAVEAAIPSDWFHEPTPKRTPGGDRANKDGTKIDGVRVVGRGIDGRLAVGWIEETKAPNVRALLYDGGFKRDATKMTQRSARAVETLDRLLDLAQDEQVLAGVVVLERLV